MSSLDSLRQTRSLAFQASGEEFSFGSEADCPLPPAQLARLRAGDAGVEVRIAGGLTAEVLRFAQGGQRWAVKQAREQCLVRNADGQTSFLNELQRHAELRALRDHGVALPGIVAPIYGSLRHGVIVSRWIAGSHPALLDERQMRQLLASACALAEQGFFEWDYSPGNLLDDGEQLWLFDFGYMYRFDPLTQLNSAGDGTNCPQYHPAERIEGRNLFGALLALEQRSGEPAAIEHFVVFKRLALQQYRELHARLRARGASALVLAHYQGLIEAWQRALDSDAALLYLKDGWRAHSSDLDDDLRGQSCTPRTLQRADWLLQMLESRHGLLLECGALAADEAALTRAALQQRYSERQQAARGFQLAAA